MPSRPCSWVANIGLAAKAMNCWSIKALADVETPPTAEIDSAFAGLNCSGEFKNYNNEKVTHIELPEGTADLQRTISYKPVGLKGKRTYSETI